MYKVGGGLGGNLTELRKQVKKRKAWAQKFYGEKNIHCYAVGIKWAGRKRPDWFKNVLCARSKEHAITTLRQANLPMDLVVLKRLD